MADVLLIKVQRITQPKLVSADLQSLSLPLTDQPDQKGFNSTFMPFHLGNQYFQLPAPHGEASTDHNFVGETFRAVVSIANISNFLLQNVNIQAEITVEHKNKGDQQPSVTKKHQFESLSYQEIRPLEVITFPLDYLLDGPCLEFLCVSATYKFENPVRIREEIRIENVEKTQVKKVPLKVELPYQLKHRGHRERKSGKVFLEIIVENSSHNPLSFKDISFETSEFYTLQPSVNAEESSKICLYPEEKHNFIFILLPSKEVGAETPLKSFENLGKLNTHWSTKINEVGKIVSPMITIPIPQHDLSLSFTKPLLHLTKEIIFTAELVVKNETNAPIDMIFNLVEKEMIGVKIISLSKNELKLGPGQSEIIVMFLLPVRMGIYKFGGIKIYNRLIQKELTFNSFPGVTVEGAESQGLANSGQESLL